MKKKLLLILLSGVLVIGLTGCVNNKESDNSNKLNDNTTTNANEQLSETSNEDSSNKSNENTINNSNEETSNNSSISSNTDTATSSFTQKSFNTSEDISLKYWLYTPKNATSNMPLILYLHGGSGKGSDLNLVVKDGFPKYLKDGELENIKAYVIIPQLPSNYRAWLDIKQSIKDLILNISENYNINENKISITGHSMGGIGTYDISLAYPELFSCMAPMSGRIKNTQENINKLSNMPIWAFVGSADTTSDTSSAIEFIDSLSKVNKNAKISILDGATHSKVPELGYKGTDVINWLISNSK